MTLTVLTAVVGDWEAPLVSGLERSSAGVQVVRRCADLVELLTAAAAGLGRAVVLSSDLQRLDRDAVAQLTVAGVAVVALVGPGDPAAATRLANLGIRHVLPADTPTEQIAQAVASAAAELTQEQTRAARVRLGIADPEPAVPPAPPGTRRSARPTRSTPRGRVIAVWGPVGAPGRTTVAVTLAAELAAAGHETLLVDGDTYGAAVAQSLGLLDESAGLAAAARTANQGGLDVDRLADLAPPVADRLRVLTGLPQSRRWPELRASALDTVWDQARGLATWTVVDAGFGLEADEELMFDTAAPRRHGATLSALTAADLVLAVGGSEPLGLQRLLSGLQDLAEVVPAGVPVQVVVTRVRDAAVGPRAAERVDSALERYAGVQDAVLVPDDRPALDAAMLAGRSLTEHAPSSPACRPIRELAHRIAAEAGMAPAAPRSGAEGGSRRRRLIGFRRSA
jgi:MinD-like ATPase involved in chromosome partitioning or flagellar assembly/DNA-binding NarL/FixJ family response regulator